MIEFLKFIFYYVLFLFPASGKIETIDSPEDGASTPDYVNVIEETVEIVDTVVLEDEVVKLIPSKYHWVIDCGHGRLTKGKRSPVLPEGGQLLEYKYTGSIGRKLGEKLDTLNIDYTIVPPDQDTVANHLKYSVDFANNLVTAKPKIFVSIHGNAGPVPDSSRDWSTSFSGIEVWYYSKSRKSKSLARIFQNSLVNKLGWRNRGIKTKQGKEFYVLVNTDMPAILTENGFYNNIRECRLMMQVETINNIADAHINAIKQVENSKII